MLRFDVNDPGISPRNLVKFIEGAARQRKLLPDGRVMIYLIAVEDHRETVRQTLEVLDQMQLAAIDKA